MENVIVSLSCSNNVHCGTVFSEKKKCQVNRPRLSEIAVYRSFSPEVFCCQIKAGHPEVGFNANFNMALHSGNIQVKRVQEEGWGDGSGDKVLIITQA